ncbi:MCE family protein [Saccharopolyspora rhizosphaerae]|uniref:MCE family protein n=1 Tax=Saccharopolyspora rhizosphaerae TaxID=2492662 RepID=A0A426JWQ2_9PSEU|nr:MlaD family protein [Saccharopolyspora rhizosphaerae]RRO17501.1 MCE family protein [Saccharopolyspora rhizosphaerae]
MVARKVKVQLALFLVIAVVGVGFVGGQYAGLDRYFGGNGYPVTVRLPESGGLFVNSEVSYRGVAVGRVSELRLTHDGIAAELHINDDAPEIPADARAVVANRSAVGEQYVDLQPQRRGGPYLETGSVIPVERTVIPPAPESLLVNVDRLVAGVPTDQLRTVVDEVGTAFDGTGPHLQKMLDATSSFTTEAQQNLPETTQLLDNSDLVLKTQQEQAQNLTEFSTGLRQISGQLKQSDPDLRKAIAAAPGAATELQELTRSMRTDFGLVAANLLTTMQLTSVRAPALEQTLVALPMVSAFTHTLSPDGTGHLGLVLNVFNPPACTAGYEGTPRKPGADTSEGPTNYDIGCTEPKGSQTGVRGSQNAVRYPVPAPVSPPAP